MFSVRRPSPALIAQFLAQSETLPLSYGPVGLVAKSRAGFLRDELTATIGQGRGDFDRARVALREWAHFTLGWLEVCASGPIEIGTVAAVVIRHVGFWSINGCRIVAVDDRDDRFSFSYGTLTNHAERGEELFEVALDSRTNLVTYRIAAASRPRAWLAYLGFPLARMLQAKCRRESADAIRRAIA